MADIKLVVKIPEYMFKDIQDRYRHPNKGDGINLLECAIANSKPLPKGHGRLIDMKKLQKFVSDYTEYDAVQLILADREDYLPTIIEADKEQTDGNVD